MIEHNGTTYAPVTHCTVCGKQHEITAVSSDGKCSSCSLKPAGAATKPPIGWVCPVCGRGVSPWHSVCYCRDFNITIRSI